MFYRNNKIFIALTVILPMYWIILWSVDSLFSKMGDAGFGLIVFYFLFPILAGLVTFSIMILPVNLYIRLAGVFFSLVSGLGTLCWIEGHIDVFQDEMLLVLYILSLIIFFVLYYIFNAIRRRFNLKIPLFSRKTTGGYPK